MDRLEIEDAINGIMSESEFFTEDNPVTYLIFLDRYKHMLNELQINNTYEIINNIKARNNHKTDVLLKKFNDPICSLPLEQRPKFEVEENEFKE